MDWFQLELPPTATDGDGQRVQTVEVWAESATEAVKMVRQADKVPDQYTRFDIDYSFPTQTIVVYVLCNHPDPEHDRARAIRVANKARADRLSPMQRETVIPNPKGYA